MKLFNRILGALIVSLCQISFAAGPGGSGGGNAVISNDGAVRFLDLIPASELPSDGMSSHDILKNFFVPKRYVKTIAKGDPDFFTCAIGKMDQRNLVAFQRVRKLLTSLIPLKVEFRIPSVPENSGTSGLNLPVAATASSRIGPDLQEPLAAYAKGRLWISGRISDKMSDRDRCGLGVHEGLRHLNFANILEKPLTTDEIETATRWVMESSEPGDQVEAVVTKLNAVNKTAQEWGAVADAKMAESQKIDDYRFANFDSLTEEQQSIQRNESYALDDQANEAIAKAIGATLDEVDAQVSISSDVSLMFSAALNDGMTSPAGFARCYDVVKLKKVTRPLCNN